MTNQTNHNHEDTDLKDLVSELDEHALASLLAIEFEDYLARLSKTGWTRTRSRRSDRLSSTPTPFAVARMASLADRAGHVNWQDVARQLETMLNRERRPTDTSWAEVDRQTVPELIYPVTRKVLFFNAIRHWAPNSMSESGGVFGRPSFDPQNLSGEGLPPAFDGLCGPIRSPARFQVHRRFENHAHRTDARRGHGAEVVASRTRTVGKETGGRPRAVRRGLAWDEVTGIS